MAFMKTFLFGLAEAACLVAWLFALLLSSGFPAGALAVLLAGPVVAWMALWKGARRYADAEEARSMASAVSVAWVAIAGFSIAVYVLTPPLMEALIGHPINDGCATGGDVAPCNEPGCLTYALKSLCSTSKTFLGAFAMISLLNALYVYIVGRLGKALLG